MTGPTSTSSGTAAYDALDVPVDGGTLHVGRWRTGDSDDPEAPVVLAAHGVTANHRAWTCLARHLADRGPIQLVAPDLRGRGGSADLTGPAGMKAHAADLRAVLDHLGVDRAVLLGHSMGGFVASAFAAEHSDRTAAVLLVDGGLPLPDPPPGLGPEEVLAATIGPAADRLGMTFADTEAYLDFWRAHPALGPAWSAEVADYFAYDLVGEPPSCRSSVALAAVREDSVDLIDAAPVAARAAVLPEGTVFLRADHGMLGEPGGLYPATLVQRHAQAWPQLRFRDVEGINHYTLVMADAGACVVADALAELNGRLSGG